jgi:hypoxia up-regulated 1
LKLDESEYEKASTPEERDRLMTELSTAGEWLEYESDGAETSALQEKLADLKASSRSLFDRVKEHRDRPEAVKALKDMLNVSTIFLGGMRNMTSDLQIFTDIEMNVLDKLIGKTEQWVEEVVGEQERLPLSLTPKVQVKDIAMKIAALDREVKYLVNKARITPPPVPKKKVIEPKDAEEEDTPVDEAAEAEGSADGEGEEKGADTETGAEPDPEPEPKPEEGAATPAPDTTGDSTVDSEKAKEKVVKPEADKTRPADGEQDSHSVPSPTSSSSKKDEFHTEL